MQRPETLLKTLSVRVKDRHAKMLSRMAFEVNQVWNLANELSYEAWHIPVPEVGWIQGVWLSAFDIQKQLGGKKNRVRAIHARIKNRRKDALHQFSSRLVKANAAIFVGNVSSARLVRTRMAKSVLDAGWSTLRTQRQYKAIAQGVVFEEVDEAYTTQACSCCGVISASSPKGRAGLGIREWTYVDCGAVHDRDINAARNILALGHERLAGGIPRL